jgi:type I restriction enzyme, S subunit
MSEADSIAYPWPARKLEGMTTKIGSGATPRGGKDVYTSQGTAFIRSQNVLDNRMDVADIACISDEAAHALRGVEVRSGDVLLNITGDSVARCCLADPAILPARVSQHVAIIRSTGELNPRFLQKFMVTPGFKEFMMSICSGGTRNALTKAQIGNFRIPVPPRPVQDAIAAVLGALDDKIAVNDRIVETSRDLMKLKYAEVADAGVEEIGLGEAADVFDGPHATPEKTESGPWFLSISSLQGGRLVLRESAHLSEDEFVRWTRRVTPSAGDVLFSYETRLGEAALMPAGIRACLGRRMALLRPRGMGSRTLLQAFLSSSFQETIRRRTVHGATVDRILLKDLPSWQIDLPSGQPEELERDLSKLDAVAERRERENETLIELQDSLLPKLMSGGIRVRDAEKVVEDVT